MKERTEEILEVAVKDFIKCGKPITSEYLYGLRDFGIKPAMIRWELNELSEAGYFYQTHPSGGRYPTDKAYKFVIERMMAAEEEPRALPALGRFRGDDIKSMVHEMSGYLNALSVAYDYETDTFYGSGLRSLLENLETAAKEEIVGIVGDYESLEEKLLKKRDWLGEECVRVFVGESPLTKSEHLSVVAGKCAYGGKEILLFTIGPKRMDYGKSVGLFKALAKSGDAGKRKKKQENDGRGKDA